jgi:hypothetical protein
MVNAIERFTLLRESFAPDIDRRDRAAGTLLIELTQAARIALWEVTKLDAGTGIVVRMPCNFRNGVRIVVVDGNIHGFDALEHQLQRAPNVLAGRRASGSPDGMPPERARWRGSSCRCR